MCFTLYLGSSIRLPFIEWNKDEPAVHTGNLQNHELGILHRLKLPFTMYIGSVQGCGCGFRHALRDKQAWLPVVAADKEELSAEQQNHQGLWKYLTDNLESGSIEIYACWNGDVNGSPDWSSEIRVEDILDRDFYFKEGWLYRVTRQFRQAEIN